jgi:hypothetical protein
VNPDDRLRAIYADWLEKGWIEPFQKNGQTHYRLTELGRWEMKRDRDERYDLEPANEDG